MYLICKRWNMNSKDTLFQTEFSLISQQLIMNRSMFSLESRFSGDKKTEQNASRRMTCNNGLLLFCYEYNTRRAPLKYGPES